MAKEPKKRGPKPERLVIPAGSAGKVLDRLFATPPEKRQARAGKPGKKKPGSR
jgi:hypothetical protein